MDNRDDEQRLPPLGKSQVSYPSVTESQQLIKLTDSIESQVRHVDQELKHLEEQLKSIKARIDYLDQQRPDYFHLKRGSGYHRAHELILEASWHTKNLKASLSRTTKTLHDQQKFQIHQTGEHHER